MLATPLTNAFHNFKCGEIYCISSAVYNVTCCLCATKMELDNFTSHFLVHHLTLAEEGIILEKEGPVKEEEPEDDPIKQEKQVNEDDKTLEQLIKETENESLLTEIKDLSKGEHEIEVMAEKPIPFQNDKLLFPCFVCKRTYRSKNSFYNHKSKVHNLKKSPKETKFPKAEHKCKECNWSFRWARDLRGHKCKHYGMYARNSKKLQTKTPPFVVEQEQNVDLSEKENQKQNINITSKENEIISNELKNYEDDNNMDRDSAMEINFIKNESVWRKRNLQNDKLLFPCLICKRFYRSKNSYYNHKSKVHNHKKPHKKTKLFKAEYKCQECNWSFRWARDLRGHKCKDTNIFATNSKKLQTKAVTSLSQLEEKVDILAEEHEEQNNITSKENDIICNKLEDELEEYEDDDNDMDRDWFMEDNCSKSKSVTRNKRNLQNDKLLFPCLICKRFYRSKNSYYNHKSKVHNLKKSLKKNKLPKIEHKCGECNNSFRSIRDLRGHNCIYTAAASLIQQKEKVDLLVKEDDKLTTEILKENEIGCDEVEKELKEYEDDKNDMDWSMEDKWSESESDTKDTNNVPKNEKIFPCLICNRSYRSKHSFSNHKRRVHTAKTELANTEHKCNECNETFNSARNLRGHMWKHTGIFCDICGKSFAQPSNLNRHKIRHTGIKAHKCKECDKEFFTDKELKAHMISHTGLRSVICEICGKQCRDRGLLTAHMRRHTGERPAKCEVCCKSFYSFHDLNIHAVTHTSERPFKCEICDSTFQRKKSLRIHKLIHLKDRKHVCKICGKGFTVSSGLNSHMRTHDAALEKTTMKTANFLIPTTTTETELTIMTSTPTTTVCGNSNELNSSEYSTREQQQQFIIRSVYGLNCNLDI